MIGARLVTHEVDEGEGRVSVASRPRVSLVVVVLPLLVSLGAVGGCAGGGTAGNATVSAPPGSASGSAGTPLPLAAAGPTADIVAVSAREVWASEIWAGGEQVLRWWRYRDGTWQDIGPDSRVPGTLTGSCSGVLATDGALWLGGPYGLTRVTADEIGVDVQVPEPFQAPGSFRYRESFYCGGLAPGPDGSVWAEAYEDLLVRFRKDGTMVSLPPPPDLSQTEDEEGRFCVKAFGIDGTAWLTGWADVDDSECDDASRLIRWDGRGWARVESPSVNGVGLRGVPDMVSTDDGATWASFYPDDEEGSYDPRLLTLWRYASGRWTQVRADPLTGLQPAPGGRVCGIDRPEEASRIVCFDAQGRTLQFNVSGMGVWEFKVAPDGAIWVQGEQIVLARLDKKLPTT